ncbi:inositol monophosphatase family protein [Zavarzinia sp. CC-PAN008]|uniref:inositol monophosphatase family protein n=1 Tax=Zavarzinia sp. CC-PAN008 TaxID=3243332 RepID=UPI003F744E0D
MALRSALINVMVGAAQKAARGLTRDFGEVENLQVSKKGPADFVSTADLKAERIIKAELAKARPGFGFLMEESGVEEGTDRSHRWIVDPLDGTTNFLHGIPHFCISIALERDGDVIAGVILNPITDELYWTEKGRGAYLNERRLRVSGRTALSEALFATGIPFRGKERHKPFLLELATIMREVAGIRRMGSAALDLAYVAAGRYEGYWECPIQAWDIAAGILMVREAGGYVTDDQGGEEMFNRQAVVAANDQLQRPLLDLVRRPTLKATSAD